MAPAKLHAQLTVDGGAPQALAKLSVDGTLGKVRVAFDGESAADLVALSAGDLTVAGKLYADDGKQLVAMLGLDRVVAADTGAGTLTFDARGPLRGELTINAALSAGGLQANATGTASPFADKPSAGVARDDRARRYRSAARRRQRRSAGDVFGPSRFDGQGSYAERHRRHRRRRRVARKTGADAGDAASRRRRRSTRIASRRGLDRGGDRHAGQQGSGLVERAVRRRPVRRLCRPRSRSRRVNVDLSPQLTAREFRASLAFGKRSFRSTI